MDMASGVVAHGPTCTIGSLLEEFFNVQSTRAQTYTLLHEGFREFLKSKDEAPFVKLMENATQVFKKCSQEVIRIEQTLRKAFKDGELADMLRTVQEGERLKLKATMALQSLRRVYEVDKFSWQHVDDAPSKLEGACNCGTRTMGISEVTSGISFLNLAAGGSVDINRVDGGEEGEPSRADYHGAVGEATHMLASAITDVNEALEEIRYARVDCMERDTQHC